ncbi:MAG: nitrous oxide reductase accessory protein NosL [Calditrichaceae bacterium]
MRSIMIFITGIFLMATACSKKEEPKTENLSNEAAAETHYCANCGMKTNDYPVWEKTMVSADHGTEYFDSAKCMFTVLLDSAKAPGQISEIITKDFVTSNEIDAREAYYVIGSDVMGPMGKDLVSFGSRNAAQTFVSEHGGDEVLAFDEVNMGVIQKLSGKMMMK